MTQLHSFAFADLPIVVQDRIFDFFTYKELGQIRLVSHEFYDHCAVRLNRGFRRLHSEFDRFGDEFRNEMPRRRSKREKVSGTE